MICLTFDTDHMDEVRMSDFLRRIDIPGAGTFFCTQKYDCLDGASHEVAPHPTLEEKTDWQAELKRMRDLFPDAKSWRSHSCVFSHLLAEWLHENGYLYVSTNDQFGQKGIQPVRHPWGVRHFPIYYMDNMDFSSCHFWKDDSDTRFSDTMIEHALEDDGVYVFDFHPIHLLLNTPNSDYYFSMRDRFKSGEDINQLAYEGYGTMNFYLQLCAAMQRVGKKSINLAKAFDAYTLETNLALRQ